MLSKQLHTEAKIENVFHVALPRGFATILAYTKFLKIFAASYAKFSRGLFYSGDRLYNVGADHHAAPGVLARLVA